MKAFFQLSLIFISLFSMAQDSAVLLEFEDEKVTKDEFIRVYQKNNSGELVEKSTVDEYLQLYINFKLKVKEAEAKGYDTLTSFTTELEGYRKQLAQPYMSAEGLMEDLKKEAYNRLEEEIRAKHILIASKSTDAPEDTLAAYKKAKEIQKKLRKGADFEKLAKEFSDDPSVATNGGDLGYFSAFYMVYPFESAAYNTKEGKISEIAKTRFGYHILKVVDRRPASGELTVAHILISSDPELSKVSDPKAKIDEIYQKLQEGESFELLAQQFSDDTRSAQQGGRLPIFGVGKMVPEFEKKAFALEKDGAYSEPFQTQFGWHIVKRLKKDEIGTYEEIEAIIDQKVKNDSRSKLTNKAVLKKIKSQYGFTENLKEKEDFYKVIDSTYFGDSWNKEKASKLKSTMFTIGDKDVSQQDFTAYLNKTMKGSRPMNLQALIDNRYELFKENELRAYKDAQLEQEYPEFKALIQEYHDGILLFNLTDELVWSKAVKDTTGLEAFYEKHKEDYRWGERLEATIYSVKDQQTADQVKSLIKKGYDTDTIVEIANESSQLNVKVESRKYEKGDNQIIDQIAWKKGISKDIEQNKRTVFVHVKEKIAPTYKTLSDSRGLITSDYQEYLEDNWIKSLRKKYSYKVDQEVLSEIKSKVE